MEDSEGTQRSAHAHQGLSPLSALASTSVSLPVMWDHIQFAVTTWGRGMRDLRRCTVPASIARESDVGIVPGKVFVSVGLSCSVQLEK